MFRQKISISRQSKKNREPNIFRFNFSSEGVLLHCNEIGVLVRRKIGFDSAESMMYTELCLR